MGEDLSEERIARAERAYWDALALDDGENLGEGVEGAMSEEQIAQAIFDTSGCVEQRCEWGERPCDCQDGAHRCAQAYVKAIPRLAALPPASGDAYDAPGRRLERLTLGYQQGRAEALEEAEKLEFESTHEAMDRAEFHAGIEFYRAAIRALARAPEQMNQYYSVVPCSKGAQCNWPACPPECPERPGREMPAASSAPDATHREARYREALEKIAKHDSGPRRCDTPADVLAQIARVALREEG